MKIVYIASPYAGDTEANTEKAIDYCAFAVSRGVLPLAPHLLFPLFLDEDDIEQRELGLSFGITLLDKCDELWVCGDEVSKGMAAEIKTAQEIGIPIKYFSRQEAMACP